MSVYQLIFRMPKSFWGAKTYFTRGEVISYRRFLFGENRKNGYVKGRGGLVLIHKTLFQFVTQNGDFLWKSKYTIFLANKWWEGSLSWGNFLHIFLFFSEGSPYLSWHILSGQWSCCHALICGFRIMGWVFSINTVQSHSSRIIINIWYYRYKV